MKAAALIVAFLALLSLGACWQIFAFHECKKVGHSTLYCVMRSGK